jgi:hypothetical protein
MQALRRRLPLGMGLALLLTAACAPGSAPAPTPTAGRPSVTPPAQPSTPTAQSARLTATGAAIATTPTSAPGRVGAPGADQTPSTVGASPSAADGGAPGQAAAPLPAADALAAADSEHGPYGLLGQRVRICSGFPMALDYVVERAEAMPHPEGGVRVVVGVEVTNVGRAAGHTFRTTRLVDERGRSFEQGGVVLSIADQQALRREFERTVPAAGVPPGGSARDTWVFLVAADVQHLALLEAERIACGLAESTPMVSAELSRAHATTVASGFARSTATAEVRAAERAGARPTGKDYGLVGQSLRFCAGVRNPKVPFDALVEQAEGVELPGDRLRVVVIVRATNAGTRPEGTFRGPQVRDERLRVQKPAELGTVSYTDLSREYGVEAPQHEILPGLSERQFWVFHVAPDAQQLTLLQAPEYRCAAPPTTAPPPRPGR